MLLPSPRIAAISTALVLAVCCVAGCSLRLPAARIAADLTLPTARPAASVSLEGAKPFRDTPVDAGIDGRAVGRREDYLADAKRKGMDEDSLERAFRTAAAAPEGAAAMTVEVRRAATGGRKVWVLVQAWGYRGQKTDKVRVWLIDATSGQVVDSASAKIP